LIHSLPQLSGSPVLRGHAGRCVNIGDAGTNSTVPSFTVMRSDMEQLQLQLQQRLSQQRVRNEHSMTSWRPVSECVDAQSIPTPAPFSRYSAPPAAGAMVKSNSGSVMFSILKCNIPCICILNFANIHTYISKFITCNTVKQSSNQRLRQSLGWGEVRRRGN